MTHSTCYMTHPLVSTHPHMWHVPIHMCVMTPSHMWHDSFKRVIWLIHVCRLIHICDMSHSHVCHDPFTRETWLIQTCDMSHSHVSTHPHMWQDSFTRVTRLILMWDTTHSYVWPDSFTCVTWLVCMCDMTMCRLYVWHNDVCHDWVDFIVMRWRKVIGFLILKCHFPQKNPIISSSFAKITFNLRHPTGLCHPVR